MKFNGGLTGVPVDPDIRVGDIIDVAIPSAFNSTF